MKLSATNLAATFLLGLIPAACHAQEFSADVVYLAINKPDAPSTGTGTSPHPSSKLYVSKDKMRLEARGLAETILLVNAGEHTVVALFPARKAYGPLPSGPSQYFRVENADDACPDWQKHADQKIVCEKVGNDMVDGRKTVKYKRPTTNSEADYIWVDPKLNYVIKWHMDKTAAELRNIAEGPQSADLFVIPQGYEPLRPSKKQSRSTSRPR
jgi:hypothetical protein